LKLSSFLSPEERLDFSIDRLQQGHFLSPVVFNNSKASKTHDSLPLELSSPRILSYLLFPGNHVVGEVMIAPRSLLVSALTLSGISTQTRIEVLQIDFWMLFIYAEPMSQWNHRTAAQRAHLGSLFFRGGVNGRPTLYTPMPTFVTR
jgi:hypothetical protein